MPRPRATSDADLLMAAARAVSKVGPAKLTLADVAAEAKVAPATLMQRFGSKRGLLLALAKLGAGGAEEQFATLKAAHPSPLAALRATAECMAGMATSPEELANHLAFLCLDLTDPEFRQYALAHAHSFRAGLQHLADAAVAAGELLPCDTARLARLLQEMFNGSLVMWALYREGAALDWLRQDMEMLLAPYLAESPRGSAARTRGPRKSP